MQISEDKWHQSRIGSVLSVFPGILGEYLQETTPQQIIRVEKILPYIFWRWFFLENEAQQISPYHLLDFRRNVEKWPTNGQFFPRPAIAITKKNQSLTPLPQTPNITIDINVDYIAFHEQPLIVDTINFLQKKELLYPYGKPYQEAIRKLAAICQKENLTIDKIQNNSSQLIRLYYHQSLLAWRKKDPFIENSFESTDWIKFWTTLLQESGTKEGLSTDTLLDLFVDRIRRSFPGYGIKSADLESVYSKDDIDINIKVQYIFWLNCAYYLLIPFSLYTYLIAPLFISQEMFRDDMHDFLNLDFEDPMPAYSPCTHITLTPFGKEFLKKN